jgi:nitrate reductase cytochrome c-type subunit
MSTRSGKRFRASESKTEKESESKTKIKTEIINPVDGWSAALDSFISVPPLLSLIAEYGGAKRCVSCKKPALAIGCVDRQLKPSYYSNVKKDSKEDTPRDRYYCVDCCDICDACKRYEEHTPGMCPACNRDFCWPCSHEANRCSDEDGDGCYFCSPTRRDKRFKRLKASGEGYVSRCTYLDNYPEYRERNSSVTGKLQLHARELVPSHFEGSDSDSGDSSSSNEVDNDEEDDGEDEAEEDNE